MDEENVGGHEGASTVGESSSTPQASAPAQAGDWKNGLPEEVQNWQEASTAENGESFWGQMANMRSRLGRSLALPSDDATPEQHLDFRKSIAEKVPGVVLRPGEHATVEEIDAYHVMMGRPSEAAGYLVPEEMMGAVQDDVLFSRFRDISFKHGLNNDQFNGVMSDFLAETNSTVEGQKAVVQAGLTTLQTEWGSTYESRKAGVLRLAQATKAPVQLIESLVKGEAGQDTIKWLHSLGTSLGSEGAQMMQDPAGTTASDVMTPGEAEHRIAEIKGRSDRAYWQKDHPENVALIKRVVQLQQFVNPDAPHKDSGTFHGREPIVSRALRG